MSRISLEVLRLDFQTAEAQPAFPLTHCAGEVQSVYVETQAPRWWNLISLHRDQALAQPRGWAIVFLRQTMGHESAKMTE